MNGGPSPSSSVDDRPSADDVVATALADADELVAKNETRAAIDRLTSANRRNCDPRVEERLVAIRHEGFTSEPAEAGQPPEPVHAESTASPSLPELQPSDLSLDTLRSGLAQHGCVLVRGLVDPSAATDLRAGIDRALAAFDAGTDGASPADTTPWYVPFKPQAGSYRVGGRRAWMRESGGVWTVDSPHMLFILLDLVERTGVGELVAEYFGERPALSANKCNLRRVPVTTATNWHQDGAFLGREVRSLNLWLALGDCGVDAPGLDIVPRRFDDVLETGSEGAMFDWSVAPDVVERAAGDAGVLRPEFGPGDALLFDHLFLHRTGVSPGMTRERHAIETWFFAPSAYPEGQIPVLF